MYPPFSVYEVAYLIWPPASLKDWGVLWQCRFAVSSKVKAQYFQVRNDELIGILKLLFRKED